MLGNRPATQFVLLPELPKAIILKPVFYSSLVFLLNWVAPFTRSAMITSSGSK